VVPAQVTAAAPVLHDRFDGLASPDEVDNQVAAWRHAVKDGSVRAGAWPGFISIRRSCALLGPELRCGGGIG
jgi:hypothetical protein